MTCGYCGSHLEEGDHRCRRCGRRPGDTLTAESHHNRTSGALARQLRPAAAPPKFAPEAKAAPEAKPDLSRAEQRPLFPQNSPKVIPFRNPAPPRPEAARRRDKAGQKPPVRRGPRIPESQESLDFLPPLRTNPRNSTTTVDAVIYCEAPVATRLHRVVAAAFDWSMVLIAYGLFLLLFHFAVGEIVLTRMNRLIFGGMLFVVAFAYGSVWALAGSETAGMRWAGLRLISFDGFPPDMKQRVIRFAGSCLSVCTAVGLLWSFADEESLNWQDHISRTFPTPDKSDSFILQQR